MIGRKNDVAPDAEKNTCGVTARRRKIYAGISLGVVLLLAGGLTYLLWKRLVLIGDRPEEFREWILSFGVWSRLVCLGVQMLQVVIALLPGEIIEIAAGYTFGYFEGTLICLGGITVGSSLIFLLTKRFGVKFVEIFVPSEKLDKLEFMRNERKLRRLVFFMFFILGTPKDLLTYFVGLTPMTLGRFLIITLIARIPSLISSTVGGHFVGEGDYLTAAVLFAVTGALSLLGMWLYSRIVDRRAVKKAKGVDSAGEIFRDS